MKSAVYSGPVKALAVAAFTLPNLAGCELSSIISPKIDAGTTYNQSLKDFYNKIRPFTADKGQYVASDGTNIIFTPRQKSEINGTFFNILLPDGTDEKMAWPGQLTEEKMDLISRIIDQYSTKHPLTGEIAIKYDKNNPDFRKAYSLCVKIQGIPCMSERVSKQNYDMAKTSSERRDLNDKKPMFGLSNGKILSIAAYNGAEIVARTGKYDKNDIYREIKGGDIELVAAYFAERSRRTPVVLTGAQREFSGFQRPGEVAEQARKLKLKMAEAGKTQPASQGLEAQLYTPAMPAIGRGTVSVAELPRISPESPKVPYAPLEVAQNEPKQTTSGTNDLSPENRAALEIYATRPNRFRRNPGRFFPDITDIIEPFEPPLKVTPQRKPAPPVQYTQPTPYAVPIIQPTPIVEMPQPLAQAEPAQQALPLEKMVRDALDTKEILPLPQIAALTEPIMPPMSGRPPWIETSLRKPANTPEPVLIQRSVPQPIIIQQVVPEPIMPPKEGKKPWR